MRASKRRAPILAGLILATTGLGRGPAHARPDGIDCPAGEITLTSGLVKLDRDRAGRGRVASPKNTFVVPQGAAIDPATESVVYTVDADRLPLVRVDLPGGALIARDIGGRVRGATLSLRRARRGFRLDVRLANLDLAGFDPASPPSRVKQMLKIGGDCFSAILSCAAEGTTVRCRPERSVLLKGSVAGGGRAPLAGVMLTAYDDGRLESISVFSQEGGRFVFPPLRPGTYRLRARLLGYEDEVRDGVTLVPGRATKVDLTLARASEATNQLHLPATRSLRPTHG